MSRCFPFPPPGYEKKACADDQNVLKKEKQKEKKHKKEKDREKREGKEKKDKVRSEEKLREKKERKDKHKDKKDKHKDKERESVLIKKDAARLPEHGSFNQVGPSPVQNCETSDSTFLLEMGKRIGNNADRATEKPFLVQKFTLAGKRNTELPGKDKGGDERKANGQHIGVGWANGFIQKIDGVHQGSIGVGGLVENSVEKRTGHGGDDKEKNGEIRGDKHKGRDREKKSEGEGGLAGKSVEKRKEQAEDSKQKNGENRGGKHKEGDREKKSKSKDKKREKEKEKEEKREKKKQKEMKKKQLKQRENSKSGAEDDNVKTALDLLEEKSCSEGNIRKRKEFGTNGYLHDNGSRANKLPKLISSVRQIVENGRKPESCKTAIRFVADVDGNKILSPLSVAGNGKITEPCTRPVPSTLQIVENGRRPEPCKPAIHLVKEVGEGNERILTSSSVAENEKILEPYPRPVSSTLQLVENERRAEPSKPAIHFVAEVEGNKRISTSSAVAQNEKILEPFRRPVSSTLQFVKNGRRPEPCKPAIHFVSEVGEEGNKGISTSSAVAEDEKISEPFPRPVSSTLQLVKNGRRPELFKPEPAIHFVTEVGEGNKGISTSSAAENEKISESFPRPGVVISASRNEENGRKIEPCKTAVSGIPVGKGNNKVSSSLSAAANGRKNDPATSSQPDLANGRKIELARTTDQSASGKHVVVINHKADNNNNNEIRVNGKEMAQPSHSLKRPPSSSKQVKEKPPHPDCKYLSSILSVPEVEWDRFDDQEWLFGGRSDLQQAKRSKVDSSPVEGTTKQVWAEALRLESGEVIALPYVVPF